MHACRSSACPPFVKRSSNSVQFFESLLIFAVGLYGDVCSPHSSASEASEELEYLIRGLACDHTIEANNLRLSCSTLEIPPIGTI
jgi:hypothetical protein